MKHESVVWGALGLLSSLSWTGLASASPCAQGDFRPGQLVIVITNPPCLVVCDETGTPVEVIDNFEHFDPWGRHNPADSVFDWNRETLFLLTAVSGLNFESLLVDFDQAHPHDCSYGVAVAAGGLTDSVTVARDAAGNLYFGNYNTESCCTQLIHKHSPDMALQVGYIVEGGSHQDGIYGLDVTADGRFLYYACEGLKIYDTLTATQLPGMSIPEGAGPDIKLLPPFDGSGGLLVSAVTSMVPSRVRRLAADGSSQQIYDFGGGYVRGLDLDPSATSFWAITSSPEALTRVNIATGAIEVGPIAMGNVGATHVTVIGKSPKIRRR